MLLPEEFRCLLLYEQTAEHDAAVLAGLDEKMFDLLNAHFVAFDGYDIRHEDDVVRLRLFTKRPNPPPPALPHEYWKPVHRAILLHIDTWEMELVDDFSVPDTDEIQTQ